MVRPACVLTNPGRRPGSVHGAPHEHCHACAAVSLDGTAEVVARKEKKLKYTRRNTGIYEVAPMAHDITGSAQPLLPSLIWSPSLPPALAMSPTASYLLEDPAQADGSALP